MKELGQAHSKTDIVFGTEPTGQHWFPLAAFLEEQGIKIVVLNPHHVNKSKELEDNSQTKSDYKDAKVIADLIRNRKYSEPNLPAKEYADLRILMNLREKVSASLTQMKRRIGNWFDRFFPEYMSDFKDWDGKASFMTMREFPLPAEIVAKSAKGVLEFWRTEVKRGVGIRRAEKLYATASASIGLTEGVAAARMELTALLKQFDLFNEQLETIMAQVLEILENSWNCLDADGTVCRSSDGRRISGRSGGYQQLRPWAANHSFGRSEPEREQLRQAYGHDGDKQARALTTPSTAVPSSDADGC